MPNRSEVFYEFINNYPAATLQCAKHDDGRDSEIGVGVRHGIIEVLFVGVYNADGSVVMEQQILENSIQEHLATRHPSVESVMGLGLSQAQRFAGAVIL